MVAVSSLFSSSNIAGIRFPLDPGSSPPLHFRPLEDLAGIRSSHNSSTSTTKTSSTPIDEFVVTPGAISEAVLDFKQDPETGPFGQIALALLLLGHGYTDECHNLVTPFSWPDDIHFAAGPSAYHQTSADVRAMATYAHCLVHRREAFNVGEFGMVGFANANYWSSAVKSSSQQASSACLPHAQWRAEVIQLAFSRPKYNQCPSIQNWCHSHGFFVEGDGDDATTIPSFFESRAVHQLCATVLRAEEGEAHEGPDHTTVKAFAEEVVAAEIQILLNRALEKAQIAVVSAASMTHDRISNHQEASLSANHHHMSSSSNEQDVDVSVMTKTSTSTTAVSVDEDTAVRVMKSISSAHLDNFLTDGSILLRRVVNHGIAVEPNDEDHDDTGIEIALLSAAAGIACRLLQSQACQLRDSKLLQNPGIGVLLPTTSEAAEELAERIGRPSRNDLSVGDCFVVRLSPGQTISTGLREVAGVLIWELESWSSVDTVAEAILFVDPLFGSRGETPTTVIQWSKGTIF